MHSYRIIIRRGCKGAVLARGALHGARGRAASDAGCSSWRLIEDAPFTLALAALLLPVAAPQAVEEGFPQQQPMGSQPQQHPQQSWGAWDPAVLPPQPAMEVPLPRMLVPGYGIVDMPTSDAYGPGGARTQPEAGEEDATSSYNATEIMGSLEGEIRRLEAQIKLSFHKEVRGSRIEPRGVG